MFRPRLVSLGLQNRYSGRKPIPLVGLTTLAVGFFAVANASAADRFEEDRLTRASIEHTLEVIRTKHGIPGIAAAAVRAGEIVDRGAVGVRKFGAPAAVSITDRWHIGSCTKSMTATLAAVLVEQ